MTKPLPFKMSVFLGFLARRVEVEESQFTMPRFFCMCSVSFQRFAVMSSKAIEDVAQKGMIMHGCPPAGILIWNLQ
jgi:hypothetical protein